MLMRCVVARTVHEVPLGTKNHHLFSNMARMQGVRLALVLLRFGSLFQGVPGIDGFFFLKIVVWRMGSPKPSSTSSMLGFFF